MKLKSSLLKARCALAALVVQLSMASNFLDEGILIAMLAYLCFTLLVMNYLFDIAYHSIGRRQ